MDVISLASLMSGTGLPPVNSAQVSSMDVGSLLTAGACAAAASKSRRIGSESRRR
jgi:hypothetical protein